MKWTNEKLSILKDNYSNYGSKYCAELLGCSISSIQNRVHKLGLKMDKNSKSTLLSESKNSTNIDYKGFIKLNNPEVVYYLGLFWADGYMYQNKNNSTLGVGLIECDMVELEPHLDKIGVWNKRVSKNKKIESWKPTKSLTTNNKRLYEFLKENDYCEKSNKSADKILSIIPNNLKHYFFRGLSDGDGCFYYYKPKKGSTLRQFSIASSREQDWSYVEKLFNYLGIKYSISVGKSGSQIRITNKKGIKLFGNYIYQNYDDIGLSRKHKKYLEITQI